MLRHDIQDLGKQFDAEDNAAFDLWTWLPSAFVAKQHHGDYASEFRPSNARVMQEATEVLSAYMSDERSRLVNPECPCGEPHEKE